MSGASGYYLQQALNMLQLASFYVPLAMAFAIMQAITRRIFLSFGDLAMFASFAAIYVAFDAMLHGQSDLITGSLALLAAIACGAALGLAIARLVLGESLLRAPLAYMIASLGIGIALSELMRIKSMSRDVWVPPLFSGEFLFQAEGSFPVKLSLMTAWAIAMAICAVVLVITVLKFTQFGRQWRAVSQSLRLSSLCGIDANHLAALSFAMAGGLAGVTGWTASISYGGANFAVGLMTGFKAMFASVIGGFGSLRGAIVGGIVLAAIEVLWSMYFSTAYRDVAVFAIIVMVLVFRPEGLLGTTNMRESEERL